MRNLDSQKGGIGKVLLWICGSLLLLGLLTLGAGFWWYSQGLQPMSSVRQDPISVTIPEASSTRQIAVILKKAGLIRNELIFRIYTRRTNTATKLQAGSYMLSPNASMAELVEELQSNQAGVKVTLVEGWRREQMAEALEKAFSGAGSVFDEVLFLEKTEKLEGQLFPDTYIFSPSATTDDVLNDISENFVKKTADVFEKPAVNLTQEEIIILASLLEREAATDKDLPLVASVLLNRLEIGQALQVDATLQYAKVSRTCGEKIRCEAWWPTPLSEDKTIESAFNTYAHTGLPPAPIASPGLRALMAAANPETSRYLYYLTDPTGITYYSETYDEHLVKINQYLR